MHNLRYFDGKSSQPYTVYLRVEGEQIIGRTYNHRIIFSWPINTITIKESPLHNRPGILSSSEHVNSRLIITEDSFEFISCLLPSAISPTKIPATKKYLCLWFSCAIGVLIIIYFSVQLLSSPLAHIFPYKWEEDLGIMVTNTLIEDYETCESLPGYAALEKIRNHLFEYTEMDEPITIKVVKNKQLNAFAAPDNNIIIFSGVIDKAKSYHEVAGVLAHEMGHIAHKHPIKGVIKNFIYAILTTTIFGNGFGLESTGSFAQMMMMLKNGRAAENEADKFATDILLFSNLGTKGLKTFFERLPNHDPDSFSFLSTHPNTTERLKNIPNTPALKRILTKREWHSLQTICGD